MYDLLNKLVTLNSLPAEGDEVYQQIEVDMFRMAALYVLERQKPGLIAHLTLCLLQRSQRVGSRPRPRPVLTRASTTCALSLGS